MASVNLALLLLCLAVVASSESVYASDHNNKAVRERRSDDASPLQAVVENLSQQVTSLSAKYDAMQTSLNARISDLQNKLNTYATTVGFHAWGSVSPVNTVSKGTVILGHVKTNDGNAYDPNTGLFTAPVPGLYYFHATFMDHDLSDRIDALISVDGAAVAGTVADSRHGYWDNPAVAAVVHLNAGQKVQLQSNNNEVDHFYGGLYTTFSGFLIRAD